MFYEDRVRAVELYIKLGKRVRATIAAGLPAESWPGILNSLDLMPLTYR